MVGWELCRSTANLDQEDIHKYEHVIDTRLSHFVIDCNRLAMKCNREWLSDPGIGLPDPVAMAIAIDPDICTKRGKHYVEIECGGEFTRGMTIIDQLAVTAPETANVAMWQPLVKRGEPHITICWEIDVARWKRLLEKCVKKPISESKA